MGPFDQPCRASEHARAAAPADAVELRHKVLPHAGEQEIFSLGAPPALSRRRGEIRPVDRNTLTHVPVTRPSRAHGRDLYFSAVGGSDPKRLSFRRGA